MEEDLNIFENGRRPIFFENEKQPQYFETEKQPQYFENGRQHQFVFRMKTTLIFFETICVNDCQHEC
jgi:hypothetical protein